MSKLIDRLIQATGTTSPPMGFRATKATQVKPKMALVAKIEPAEKATPLADYVSGADAAIITQSGSAKDAATDIARSLRSTVWGLWLEGKVSPEIKSATEAGADFLILPLHSEYGLPSMEKVGKILLVETSLSEGLIRTINELPTDAVLLADDEESSAITWHQLMLCQRFADLLSKPLLLMAPASVNDEELQALWKTGVDGVVIPVKTLKQAARLKELRQIIDKADFAARPRKKVAALLPRISEETTTVADVEEEEEEE